jgi:hypothetical protein
MWPSPAIRSDRLADSILVGRRRLPYRSLSSMMNDFNRAATTLRTSDDDTKEGRGVALSSRQRNVQQRLYHPSKRPGQAIGDPITWIVSTNGALYRPSKRVLIKGSFRSNPAHCILRRATSSRKISVRTLTNDRYLVYIHKSGGSSLTEAYLIPFKGQSHVLRRIAFA